MFTSMLTGRRGHWRKLRHRLLVLLRQIALLHGRLEGDMAVVDLDLTQGTLA